MSTSIILAQINRAEHDIASLYKKVADEQKKENDKTVQITSINNSINKNTSLSAIQSKQRQIQTYQGDILRCKKRVADFQKQIANKSLELGRKKQELRKAEEVEQKKLQREQKDLQRKLELDIQDQKSKLESLLHQNYISKQQKNTLTQDSKMYDFFISHASEDKDEIVRELANALKEKGFQVWYDEFELKIGDSLRKKIDNGLSKCRFGIVIVSPAFIKKNWTEYELNGMVAREMNGHKVILPIWHKISKDEVLKFSPTLLDKLAMNTSIHTLDDIVKSLSELL